MCYYSQALLYFPSFLRDSGPLLIKIIFLACAPPIHVQNQYNTNYVTYQNKQFKLLLADICGNQFLDQYSVKVYLQNTILKSYKYFNFLMETSKYRKNLFI